jgi:hypothetical protein
MVNASRGDWAYTLIAVDGKPGSDVADAIRAIPGVISVRIINK